jgi:uncharacterized membrane protein
VSDHPKKENSPEWEELLREHRELKRRIDRIEEHLASKGAWERPDLPVATVPAVEQKTETDTTGQLPPISPIKPPKPPKPARPANKNIEFQIGGTWLNRIGVVAVIIGLIIFLKYSFDNQWIGPVGRVSLGILSGFALILFGERWKERYRLYAQGLFGGGSLALYISVYVAYDFYHLIASFLAFFFLVAITALTVVLAVRHQAVAIGILGIIGGYATPFLVGSSAPSLWTWFGYLTVLTVGVLAVSIYKKWYTFQYLSFLFNQVSFAAAYVEFFLFNSPAGHWWSAYIFIHIVLFLYLGIATGYNLRRKKQATGLDVSLILMNALLFFGWSLALLETTWAGEYLGYYALVLALGYIMLGRWAYHLAPGDKGQVYSLFIASFVFMTVAIPLQINGDYLALAWYAEAIGLIYAARRIPSPRMVYSALVVLGLGMIVSFMQLERLSYEDVFLLNIPTLLLVSTLIALTVSIVLLRGWSPVRVFEFGADQWLKGVLLLLVFVGLTVENDHFFSLQKVEYFLSPEQLSLSALWLLYGIALFLFGLKRRIAYLRYVALGLLAIVILKAFFIDLSQLAAIYKILLFILLGLSLLGISYFYQRQKSWIQGENE